MGKIRKFIVCLMTFSCIALSLSFSLCAAPMLPSANDVNGYEGAEIYAQNRMWDYQSEDFLYIYAGGYELSTGQYVLPELATRWLLISKTIPFYEMISNYSYDSNDTVPLYYGYRYYLDNYTRFAVPSWWSSYNVATNEDMVFSLKLNGELTIKAGEILEFFVSPGRTNDNVTGSYGNLILNNGSTSNVDFTNIVEVLDATPSNNSGSSPSRPTDKGNLSPLKFEVVTADPYYIQQSDGSEFLSEWVKIRSIPLDRDITITRIGFRFRINGVTYSYSQINRTNIFMYLSSAVKYTLPLKQVTFVPPVETLPPIYEDFGQMESAALDNLDNILGDLDYIGNNVDLESGRIFVMDIFEQLLDMSYLSLIGAVVLATIIIRAVIGR